MSRLFRHICSSRLRKAGDFYMPVQNKARNVMWMHHKTLTCLSRRKEEKHELQIYNTHSECMSGNVMHWDYVRVIILWMSWRQWSKTRVSYSEMIISQAPMHSRIRRKIFLSATDTWKLLHDIIKRSRRCQCQNLWHFSLFNVNNLFLSLKQYFLFVFKCNLSLYRNIQGWIQRTNFHLDFFFYIF